jgi:hypothetical protein
MAKKKQYKGKVIREFSTIGGDGNKPVKKVYKVGSWFYTDTKESLDYLKQINKISKL